MATFVGGMFRRVQAALGLAHEAPAVSQRDAVPPPPRPDRTTSALRRDLEARRRRYLAEVQAMHAAQAAARRAAEDAERERRAQAQDFLLQRIAESDHGVYWPQDLHLPRDSRGRPKGVRAWVGRVVDIVVRGG